MSTNYINKITDTGGTTHDIGEGVDTRLFRATCSTAASTAAKVATLDDSTNYSLAAGVRVAVTFTYGNSAATPTLNVNSGGAKTIVTPTAAATLTSGNGTTYNTWGPYETVIFTYNGTYWVKSGTGYSIYNAYALANSKTSNTGTVTQVTAGTGLSIGSTSGGNFTTSGTINHTNSVTAQTTQAIYPIKIDAQGHISAYGNKLNLENGSETGGIQATSSFSQGSNAFAEGYSTYALGDYSHSEGSTSQAGGTLSHAQGMYSIARGYCETVIGRYNVPSNDNNQTAYNETNSPYILVAGNGTGTSGQSNALTLDWKGNVIASGTITDGTGNVLSSKLNSSALLDLIYPVGSIYMSVNNVSPATFLGGTWTQIKDTFLLSAGDTYTAGGTGGAATVTLTAAQSGVRNHRHSVTNDDGDAYYLTIAQSPDNAVYRRTIKNGTGSNLTNNVYSANAIQRISNTNYTELDAASAHENMPPYLTVYMWKRTA